MTVVNRDPRRLRRLVQLQQPGQECDHDQGLQNTHEHETRIALVVGALEWVRTLVTIAAVRFSAGIPALRMVLILGTVAVLTLLPALVFRHRRLRGFYRLPGAGRNADRKE